MARLTIAWVKEYAKANGIFLVKTSTGYAVQYQRLIDELTYEDGIGYKECFKTLKEVKDWIDDQDPVDVLGIDKEVAKEIYEDAKNNRVKDDRKDALNNITANTSLRFITAQSLVFGDVEKVISDLSHNRCNALSVFEGIVVLREYTFIHPMTLDRLNEKVNDYLLTLPLEYANKILPETKEEDKEESFNEVREYALAEIKEEVKTPLETYVDDVESRENWILSLTEDELDNSGLSDQEVSFWVKNQNKNEDAKLPFKFIGMDENKLCFESSNGDIELIARAISLDYLKSHQSVIKDPRFTDLPRWANYTDLMGEVLAQI